MKRLTCLLIGILPLFASLLPVAPAQELTFTLAAPKLQAMNAAYAAVAPEDWHLATIDVPLGTMWFGIQAGSHVNAYDCGLMFRDAAGSSQVVVRLFDRDGHLKDRERGRLAARIERAIFKHLGRTQDLKEDTVIDVPDPFRYIVRGLAAEDVFRSATRDRGLWVLATMDEVDRRAVMLSPRVAAGADADVLLLHVVDLGNTEVRIDFGFRTTAGGSTHMDKGQQSGVLRHFAELLLMDLKGPRYPGAATR